MKSTVNAHNLDCDKKRRGEGRGGEERKGGKQ
jgi:hypothetical protein